MHRSLHLLIYSFILAPLSLAQFPSAPSLVPIASYSGCPPNGPLLPRPTNLALSKHVQAAARNLSSTIDSAVKGEIRAGWPVDNVSFSLAFVTPNGGPGADDGKPIWEHHHRGKENTIKGTNKVTGDSQYMVGSVSKVLTDLVLLRSGVDLQRPVTDFLPELASGNSSIRWRDVTLEALAGHLAGIPPNYVYEFYFLKPLYESLGFPQLNPSDYPSCNVVGLNRDSCTEQGLLSIKPVTPVNSRPLYSQLSLTIASFCLKRATGKNYSQLLQEAVIQPLKLRNTGVSPGDSNRAVIPPGDSSWGSDFGFNAPGGGLFSSTNDLSRFLNAVLDRSVLDTPAQVRKWLQPTSMTSSPTTLVGEPWEILRTTSLVPAHPHTIDIHGKSGGAINYVAQVSLVDQYGVGVVVLTAGPVDSTNILYRAILGTLIPAIDEEARDQSQKYTGPGLKIDSLNRNGSSIVDALQTIFLNQYTSVGFGILNSDFRIYPTEIESPVPSDEARALLLSRNSSGTDIINEGLQEYNNVDLIRQDWRINLDIVPLDGAAMSDLAGQNSLSPFCASWQVVDWMHYGGEAMDRVVFVLEKGSGRLVGVEVPSLRGGLLT